MLSKGLQVRVISREGAEYDGKCEGISSINPTGEFDVLEDHANFITPVTHEVTVYIGSKRRKVFKLKKGLVMIKDNVASVFVGI